MSGSATSGALAGACHPTAQPDLPAAGRVRCDHTAVWPTLQAHYATQGQHLDLRNAFAQDAQRFERFSQNAPYVFADLSKNRTDAATEQLLMTLARQCGLEAHRDAMFAGEKINTTEQREVWHTLLRKPALARIETAREAIKDIANCDASQAKNVPDVVPEVTPGVAPGVARTAALANGPANAKLATELAKVHTTLDAMLAYAGQVRADAAITDVVNIGIGGSDLGPQMAVLALDAFADSGKRLHFVSNVDGHELAATLKRLKPQSTLFLIASKTFTTIETMTNARSAKAWFEAEGGTDTARHFCALTTNVAAANAFGITTTFGFWDWVGGRYSMWSAIGLPLAIAIGAAGFRDFLAGAHAMDEHFRTAPLEANLPVRLGLLDVWYRNFHGFTGRSIAPYHSALRRYPAYLQQLEMESNGKQVDMDGNALPYGTSPTLWGEPGTNGQHAYFQMLHQGTDVVPVEFVAVKTPRHTLPGHHPMLLANVLAQAQALMVGKRDAAGPPQSVAAPSGGSESHAVDVRGAPTPGGHKNFPGNRPSTFLLLDDLTPASLGALIALQEHRVFVSGSIWGINSFDQWGVELGKVLAKDIEPRLTSGDVSGLDGSTAGLLARLRG